jgi:hypothetical protein
MKKNSYVVLAFGIFSLTYASDHATTGATNIKWIPEETINASLWIHGQSTILLVNNHVIKHFVSDLTMNEKSINSEPAKSTITRILLTTRTETIGVNFRLYLPHIIKIKFPRRLFEIIIDMGNNL